MVDGADVFTGMSVKDICHHMNCKEATEEEGHADNGWRESSINNQLLSQIPTTISTGRQKKTSQWSTERCMIIR
jgi:hypothetical protein